MTYDYARAGATRRAMRRVCATAPASWAFARFLHHVDRPLFRLTKGRHTFASLVTGLPVVMLTTTGARSGAPRTLPLLGLPTSEGLAVIASNWGQDRHPAWHYNLRAHPQATVVVDGQTRKVTAVLATGDRRDRIWQQGLKIYPGWTQYARRAPGRDMPIYVLEPSA
ncbi:nitroreductase family deazaflavin-dependent oxidoreductase [Paractinoplanes atraurantiacus]|uniref:Deazaflavin-dependent oxidoreductase, nitroreductase family n=1 Tax=Paractinoplanes atraurantiacus TaxID=1036182 RepID=A0A285IKT9_9ACTN|nr:nitroreductase family deazaflavin-dependent oxidoreductase [Actinoplanes atraurantiacus]SNY48595.1 deazaflavin-dependent oxidoreductase, nitroreductase family [Actinoplanes atraurantiacus]